MKRKYIIFAVVAAAVLSLTACSSLKKTEIKDTAANPAAGVESAGSTAVQEHSSNSGEVSVLQEEGPVGEIIPDEDAAAAENDISGANDTDVKDNWTGAYVGEEETVTITLLDDTAISFGFSNSGITGRADVNGMQAVYKGDDHYVVVFNMNDGILDVSVSNEEDYDASESPLNGTYIKE